MSADMKSVKLRIKSVQNTMQITRAMQLVAASKLRKAKQTADNCRPYFEELHQTLIDIASGYVGFLSPYIKKVPDNKRCCYVLIAGDRGMAGGYNANMFRLFESSCKDPDPVILPIGKRALEYALRKKHRVLTENFAVVANVSVADSFSIASLICGEYLKDSFEHIVLCYTKCQSMLNQVADIIPVLPFDDIAVDTEAVNRIAQTLYDPNSEEVFNAIVPEYIAGIVHAAICESVASEYAARQNAMDAATKNAGEMLEQLNLNYNRARQASITQELTEIVAGAEGV